MTCEASGPFQIFTNDGTCLNCLREMSLSEGPKPRLVPVTPTIVAGYYCTECFERCAIAEIIRNTKDFLMSESELLQGRLKRWLRGGPAFERFRDVKPAILYLRGIVKLPPFPSRFFSAVRDLSIQGNPSVTVRKHLTLVSWE